MSPGPTPNSNPKHVRQSPFGQGKEQESNLRSLPFHCLNRRVFVISGSSENHSSLESGGRMQGSSGSSDTISTFKQGTKETFGSESQHKLLTSARIMQVPHTPVAYPCPRISSPDGSGSSKSSCTSTDQQERSMGWTFWTNARLCFWSCKQQITRWTVKPPTKAHLKELLFRNSQMGWGQLPSLLSLHWGRLPHPKESLFPNLPLTFEKAGTSSMSADRTTCINTLGGLQSPPCAMFIKCSYA